MFFLVFMLVVVITLCLFEAVSVDNFFSSSFTTHLDTLVTVIVDMFLYSYHGEKVLHESLAINDMIYNSNWYLLNIASPNKKALKEFLSITQLTMIRAEQPFKISVGGFTSINYETFVTVRWYKRLKRNNEVDIFSYRS